MDDEKLLRHEGVSVRRFGAAHNWRTSPVVLIHDGFLAGWSWSRWAPYLADAGYTCYVVDWLGHGDSDPVPADIQADRSIQRLAQQELRSVAYAMGDEQRRRRPVLVGHGMGALAAMTCAADPMSPATALALITPALPMQLQADPVDIEVTFGELCAVPEFEAARSLLFPSMTESQARHVHRRMVPESSRAVWEATRPSLWVQLKNLVACPTLVVAAERDALVPVASAARLAESVGAEGPVVVAGQGHCDVLLNEDGWFAGAQAVREWLDALPQA